ncbi:MAG: proteasome assembly chaperone family protein [Candidatus Altiarchaeota archaeon]|nr:proteasome assembly chaperone family protein [Candidatus Altiarchaeota archaeon]
MKIIELEKMEKGLNYVLGFPGEGMVGAISSEFIIHKLKFKQVGYISSNKLPALVIVRDSRPQSPIRIYKKGKLVILVSDIMIPDAVCHEFSEHLVEWLKSKNPKEVVVLGGMPQKKQDASKKLYVVSWKDKYLDQKMEHMKLGFIVGIYGPLLMNLSEAGAVGYMVLSEATQMPDPIASAGIVKHLSSKFSLKLDHTPLLKGAAEKKIKGPGWDPYPSIYG